MKRHFLSVTILATATCAMPAYCQGSNNQQTPEQVQLNQHLSSPQDPLKIIQQHEGVSNSSLTRLINDMKGMVKDMVQIDKTHGDPKVHVKAPFVDVDVEDGQPNVNVHAPFVDVTKHGGSPASVKAPFTKLGDYVCDPQSTYPATNPRKMRVKAPFVNVGQDDVNVHAPFTNVESKPGHGTQIKAPFTNLDTDPSSGSGNALP